MCVNVRSGPNGDQVVCHHCWQCRSARLADYLGRSLAEQSTSVSTVAVTLTYAPGTPHAFTLVLSDVQKLLKRLRKAGAQVRYLASGEYGETKGRAHWHLVLFFQNAFPIPSLGQRLAWDYWPHGFSYFQHPDANGIRYVLKYVLKAQLGQGARLRSFALSTKPPLGFHYLWNLGREYARHGHLPPTPFYGVPNSPRSFLLQGSTRDAFLRSYAYHSISYWGPTRLDLTRNLPSWAWDYIGNNDNQWWEWFYGQPQADKLRRTVPVSLPQPVHSTGLEPTDPDCDQDDFWSGLDFGAPDSGTAPGLCNFDVASRRA